jgi:hypothetical protein
VIRLLGYISLLVSFTAYGLVPVEGILMGEAREDFQQDPLNYIFSDIYDKSQKGENTKIKLYHNTFLSGSNLNESCSLYGTTMAYGSPWREKQAQRSVVATLQYIGLDTMIKTIGSYARVLEVGENDYNLLAANLVKNYCSKNITVFSLRNIEKSLKYYYSNPSQTIIPDIQNSPFATEAFKYRTEGMRTRSRELDYAIKGFRSFCSWGGDVEDYRLMAPYLSNPFIMSFIIKNMAGVQDRYFEPEEKVQTVENESTVQVVCEDLICRNSSTEEFLAKFPLSVGSTGLRTDLTKLYCNHFRYQNFEINNTLPEVKNWIKESELEDPIFETNFFISIMTGVPDPFMGMENYHELPFIVKSSVDERWNRWAREVLNIFSKDLMFEESLKIKAVPNFDPVSLATKGFRLDFTVTLGELDRMMNETDKLDLKFNLKLSKNYLRSLKTRWIHLTNEVDLEGKKRFENEIAEYLNIQLEKKENLFSQQMWNEDFKRLIADELLKQVLNYQGPLFNSYQEEVFTIPVRFSYGVFALSYLRYRADVKSNRLRLNL